VKDLIDATAVQLGRFADLSQRQARSTGALEALAALIPTLLDPNLQALELGLRFAHVRECFLPYLVSHWRRSLFAALDTFQM
jgi:hypothetical protein